MSETVYPRGGAYGTFNSLTLSAYDDWSVGSNIETFDQDSNTRGTLAQRMKDLRGSIKIKPRASLSNIIPQLNCFMPFLDPNSTLYGIGAQLFPSTNLPFVVQTKDGRSLTAAKCAVVKPSKMTLGPRMHLWDELEIGALIPNAYALGAASSWLTDASSAYTEPVIADSDEYFGAFAVSFGSGPLSVIPGVAIVIENEVTLEYITPSQEPTRNATIVKTGLTVEFVPINCTTSQLLSTLNILAGSGAASIGAPIVGGNITISDVNGVNSGGLNLVIPVGAGIGTIGVRYSNKNSRVNTIKYRSQQVTSATANQSFYDGVCNNSTAFASATATFVSGDAGKTITGANIPGGTTISTVTNGTTLVLSASTTGGSLTGQTFTIVNRALTGWQPLMIASVL